MATPTSALPTLSSLLQAQLPRTSIARSKRVAYYSCSSLNGTRVWTAIYKPQRAATATQTSFDSYDLLYRLLTCLQPNEILALRAVARSWRDVIASSLPLRRLVFLAAAPGPLPAVVLPALPDVDFSATTADVDDIFIPLQDLPCRVRVNSVFRGTRKYDASTIWTCYSPPLYGPRQTSYGEITFNLPMTAVVSPAMEYSIHKSAYITQPPCTALSARIDWLYPQPGQPTGTRGIDAVIKMEDGITFGTVVANVREAIRRCEGGMDGDDEGGPRSVLVCQLMFRYP